MDPRSLQADVITDLLGELECVTKISDPLPAATEVCEVSSRAR